MTNDGPGKEIERLIDLMAKLPGLGPRSARRAVLTMIKKRDRMLTPLARAMTDVAESLEKAALKNVPSIRPIRSG